MTRFERFERRVCSRTRSGWEASRSATRRCEPNGPNRSSWATARVFLRIHDVFALCAAVLTAVALSACAPENSSRTGDSSGSPERTGADGGADETTLSWPDSTGEGDAGYRIEYPLADAGRVESDGSSEQKPGDANAASDGGETDIRTGPVRDAGTTSPDGEAPQPLRCTISTGTSAGPGPPRIFQGEEQRVSWSAEPAAAISACTVEHQAPGASPKTLSSGLSGAEGCPAERRRVT
jgi:hypothetical protein